MQIQANQKQKELSKSIYKNDIIALEGGSRSGKTYSLILFFIFDYFLKNANKRITVTREKLTWLKDTLLQDFQDICEKYNVPVTPEIKKSRPEQRYTFWNNNEISFIGVDERQKLFGRKQNISWINEIIGEGTAYDITKKDYDQINMRTTEKMICDYNPKAAEHWVYDIADSTECCLLKSTMLDNPFLEQRIINTILGYEPTAENIEKGTADEVMWKIYGLGQRASHSGLIYPDWNIVDEIPQEAESLGMWLDLGFSNNPTACGELYLHNGELYVKEYFYETGLTTVINKDNPQQLSIEQRLIENNVSKNIEIHADNEGRTIRELRMNGWNIYPFIKYPGSVIAGINIVKKYKVNILSSSINIIKEKNNYKWKEHAANGVLLNEPVKAYDHHMDGIRSICLYYNRISKL